MLLFLSGFALEVSGQTKAASSTPKPSEQVLTDFVVDDADGKPFRLAQYRDHVILVVNVASRCGLTPQYEGLEALHRRFKGQRFVVLGFPSNQFGSQEPGSNQEIQKFCRGEYGVTFPVLSKVDVNGAKAAPIYRWLKSAAARRSSAGNTAPDDIPWNFTKFLIDRDGLTVTRFEPRVTPDSLAPEIVKRLATSSVR